MRDERGAACVEMALFAMFLVLVLSGVIDLGRGLYSAIALNDAVQEGAMYAAFTEEVGGTPLSAEQVRARVTASTDSLSIDPSGIAVTCVEQARARQSATRVTVAASHDVDLITPFVSDWFGGTLTLDRSATADRFFAACPTGSGP